MSEVVGGKFRVDGKIALITGAGRGLGLAFATALAESGAHVFLNDVTEEAAVRGAESLAAIDLSVTAVPFDVTNKMQTEQAIDGIERRTGRIDILINNAGIVVRNELEDATDADWNRVVDVNLSAIFRVSQQVGLSMARRGTGSIINVSSIFGIRGRPGVISYVSTKHGLIGLTLGLAAELGPHGVRVNAVAPGYVCTEINREIRSDPDFEKAISSRTALKRWAQPYEIAGPVVFLASDAASYVHGATLVVDGGISSTILPTTCAA